MQWCKYLSRGSTCPYECQGTDIICHEWARGECKYQNYAQCRYGRHAYPARQCARERSPRAPNVRRNGQEVPEHERPIHKVVETTVQGLWVLIREQLYQLRDDEHEEAIRRFLRALHHDRVNTTELEPVFTRVTRMLNSERERVRGHI